jgi:hypothetical protein
MANNPYSVEITADATHSVNRREFVVFGQSLVNTKKNKSILIFQNIEMSVFIANLKHIVNTLNFHIYIYIFIYTYIYIYDNNNLVQFRRLSYYKLTLTEYR